MTLTHHLAVTPVELNPAPEWLETVQALMPLVAAAGGIGLVLLAAGLVGIVRHHRRGDAPPARRQEDLTSNGAPR